MYWVTQKLPQIYAANHATFSIWIRKITVQNCGNFLVTQYTLANVTSKHTENWFHTKIACIIVVINRISRQIPDFAGYPDFHRGRISGPSPIYSSLKYFYTSEKSCPFFEKRLAIWKWTRLLGHRVEIEYRCKYKGSHREILKI